MQVQVLLPRLQKVTMHKHIKTQEIINLRKKGKSHPEIEKQIGVNRSTIHYILKRNKVELTEEQERRLKKRNSRRIAEISRNLTDAERKERAKKGAATRMKNGTFNKAKLIDARHLVHEKCELQALEQLEESFDSSFEKEKIGGRYFDFVNEDYVIEHSTDYGKGITLIYERFKAIQKDNRVKLAFINMKHFGEKRKNRFREVGVHWFDYRILKNTPNLKKVFMGR